MTPETKLKVAAEEIKEVLKKHDIAASVALHTPGHGEYFVHLNPSYSCAYMYNDEEVRFHRKQASILSLEDIEWIAGDSNEVLDEVEFKDIDFVYSCPPYADLEKYSDDPKDLSNMDYADFKEVYFSIIKKAVAQLKEDRFACFVVGDVRDKKGFYYNFVSDTIQAFKDAGMELYNEIILVNTVGSLAIRVRRQFNGGRKVGKMHQNVLVFYKGDPKKIKDNFPELNLGELEETPEVI